MWQATTISEARAQRGGLRGTVAFVPTMGALHEGHASLIRAARALADHVLVSIFVNPTQFGPSEDLARYPRTPGQDLALCTAAGAAGVFCPTVEQMYPGGGPTPQAASRPACLVTVPALAGVLEGAFRPTHFQGVCQVVAKLLHIVEPDVACFGRKDYQQLKVIEAMVEGLNMRPRIVGLPTIREPDGLALSSRNRYLDAEQRPRAAALYKALQAARSLVEDEGETDPAAVESAMRTELAAHHVTAIDYAALRHPQSLAVLDCIEPRLTGGVVALLACHLGPVRLIDNMVLGGKER
jgi:pantoate--beta-alanine ligase